MLEHLKTTHTESYKNMNQSADFWKSMSIADEQKILADFESSKNKFMLAAVADNRIIGGLGFVGYQAEFTKHSAQLGMSVQQAFANSGLGTAMLKYTIELAKEFGFHRIDLSVRTYNTAGIALIDGNYVDEYSYQLTFE